MKVEYVVSTPDAENMIIRMARVSSPKKQDSPDNGLIRFCIEKEHWSIFEMANLTVQIETSRAMAMQVIRHKSFSFQMLSRRYSEEPIEFEPIEFRAQGSKKTWHAIVLEDPIDRAKVNAFLTESKKLYNYLLSKGYSRETARFILPQAEKATLYMAGNLRSWIHYIQVRTDKSTQKEHSLIAEEVRKIFAEKFPLISEAGGFDY